MGALRFILAAVFWLAALAAGADVVSGPAALTEALRLAKPGIELRLLPGDYGAVRIDGVEGPLLLAAARPGEPPSLSGLAISSSHGITVEDLRIAYRAAPDAPLWVPAVQVRAARDVIFRRVLFDGDIATHSAPEDQGRPTGIGLRIDDSHGITVEHSEIRRFERGIVMANSEDVAIRDNHIHRLRHDGIAMATMRGVRIERNRIGDFDRAADSGDHPDMIQMWTTGTDRPSEGIRIVDNLLLSGHGLWTQSIHLRNERVDRGEAGPEMFYRDIEITGNAIANAHLNGIFVGETDGLIIRRNTLIRNGRSAGPDFTGTLSTPLIRVAPASRDVVIEGNIAAGFPAPAGPDWRLAGNEILPVATYDRAFADARHGDPLDPASYAYRPDGPLAGRTLGAPVLEP